MSFICMHRHFRILLLQEKFSQICIDKSARRMSELKNSFCVCQFLLDFRFNGILGNFWTVSCPVSSCATCTGNGPPRNIKGQSDDSIETDEHEARQEAITISLFLVFLSLGWNFKSPTKPQSASIFTYMLSNPSFKKTKATNRSFSQSTETCTRTH